MPDDRDVLRRKTPPAGVRAQTAVPIGEFDNDELTPVEGDQQTQTNKRATQAAGSSKAALELVKKVQKSQDELVTQVKVYAETDQADHKEMKGGIADVKSDVADVKADVADVKTDVADVKTDVRQLTSHVGDLREGFGEVSGQLRVIVKHFDLDAENEAHEQRIRISYKSKVKLKFWETILKIFAVSAGAGGAAWATYEVTRWLQR